MASATAAPFSKDDDDEALRALVAASKRSRSNDGGSCGVGGRGRGALASGGGPKGAGIRTPSLFEFFFFCARGPVKTGHFLGKKKGKTFFWISLGATSRALRNPHASPFLRLA